MQVGQQLLLKLLAGPNQQLEVPLYQRQYSWTDEQRQRLWDDVLRLGELPKGRRHFTGSVVYTATGNGLGDAALHQSRLIDGQQRVTTATLLLYALAESLEEQPSKEAELGISTQAIRQKYLFNQRLGAKDPGRFKLKLSDADDQTLRDILGGKVSKSDTASNKGQPVRPAQNLRDGLRFFRERLADPNLDLAQVWQGLGKLEVVEIILNEGQDDLGLIFESLNSTGKALAQADLIRNNVLIGLDPEEQQDLSLKDWQPMERLFLGAEEGSFDRFMRDFLTLRTHDLPNEDRVYAAFKAYRDRKEKRDGETITQIVQDIGKMAGHYLRIIQPESELAWPKGEKKPAVQRALRELQDLGLRVVQPFVLELMEDAAAGRLSDEALVRALRVLESFIMRRAVLGARTSPLNKFFATLGRNLQKQHDYVGELEKVLAIFQDQGRDGFPDDQAFLAALQREPLYGRPICKPLLMRLEHGLNPKETVGGVLTIEHVMPKNPKLNQSWQVMLGTDWQKVQEQWVHTLGNLTLTGYNSELGDRSFEEKKTLPPKPGVPEGSHQPKGYEYSHLLMTQQIAKQPEWTEEVIKARAAELAGRAVHLFPFPKLTPEDIQKLREEGKKPGADGQSEPGGPTISFEHLPAAAQQALEQLRTRTVDLGGVTVKPTQFYLGFRRGQSFMEIHSRKFGFRVALKLPAELDAPEEAENWKRWGAWLTRTLKTSADVDEAWPLILAAYAQQGTEAIHP